MKNVLNHTNVLDLNMKTKFNAQQTVCSRQPAAFLFFYVPGVEVSLIYPLRHTAATLQQHTSNLKSAGDGLAVS